MCLCAPATATPENATNYEWNQVAAYSTVTENQMAQIQPTINQPESCPVAFARHSGGANYAFGDIHVGWAP